MRRLLPLVLTATALLSVSVMVGCSSASEEDVGSGEDNLTGTESHLAALRAAVKNVDQEHVVLSSSIKAPTDDAGAGATAEHATIYGVDWFQKWGGGRSADHDWANGSENGKRCMWASVLRFEAIMKNAPPELAEYLATYTKWDGSFYNRNDDYSGASEDGTPAFGDAKGARIWAWRTNLSKWISATAKDGSCYLPTRKMLVDYLAACKTHAAESDDEMQGCEAFGE